MEIREATTKDWKKIRDLYLALLKSDPEAFVDEYDEISLRDEDDWVKDVENENGKTFIAVDDNKFVGMGRINFYEEIPEIPVLHKLGVLPEYRGKGIAKKLMKAREDWAKSMGAEKIRLYVIANRQRTIEFAKKNYYKVIETLKNNVERNDGTYIDILLMEKDLV